MLILGWVSDKTETRAFFVPFILSCNIAVYFIIYFVNNDSLTFWYIFIILAMALISGPQTIVSGPLAQDLVKFLVSFSRLEIMKFKQMKMPWEQLLD